MTVDYSIINEGHPEWGRAGRMLAGFFQVYGATVLTPFTATKLGKVDYEGDYEDRCDCRLEPGNTGAMAFLKFRGATFFFCCTVTKIHYAISVQDALRSMAILGKPGCAGEFLVNAFREVNGTELLQFKHIEKRIKPRLDRPVRSTIHAVPPPPKDDPLELPSELLAWYEKTTPDSFGDF